MGQEGPDSRSGNEDLRNPFRNEGDAFRLLVTVFLAGAVVVALSLFVSRAAALILAGILALVAVARIAIWLRRWIAAPERSGDDPGARGKPSP